MFALTAPQAFAEVTAACRPASGDFIFRKIDGVFQPFGKTLIYNNQTDSEVRFTTTINDNLWGGLPSFIQSFTLGPGIGETYGEEGFPAYLLPSQSDRVVIEITSDATGDRVLARCDYTLTVREQLLLLPTRWCVVGDDDDENGRFTPGEEGSLAFTNPGGVGEPNTESVLWTRDQRASEVWDSGGGTGPGIWFRPAIPAGALINIPIIPDPNPSGGSGIYGDLVSGGFASETYDAVTACDAAWNWLGMAFRVPLPGITAVNAATIDSRSIAVARPARLLPPRVDSCEALGDVTRALSDDGAGVQLGYVVISDNQADQTEIISDPAPPDRSIDEDPKDALLAHEYGHVLHLGHGNGVDDDGDGRIDDCDSDGGERRGTPPDNLMHQSLQTLSGVVTEYQKGLARAIAMAYEGCEIWKPFAGGWTPCDPARDPIGDRRSDPLDDVEDGAVDIVTLAMVENTGSNLTAFTFELRAPLSPDGDKHYVVFADLDHDQTTGGEPLKLGFDTDFQGAELVTRVLVMDSVGEDQVVKPTVWRFEDGIFVDVTDDKVLADASTPMEISPDGEFLSGGRVSIQLPNSLRGERDDHIRVQALAQTLDFKEVYDWLPDPKLEGNTNGGVPLFVTPPFNAECTVTPVVARTGTIVTVEAQGLVSSEDIWGFFGDRLVTTGVSDSEGKAILSFDVPTDARAGERMVSVRVGGTALAAICPLEVLPRFIMVDILPSSEFNEIGCKALNKNLLPAAILSAPDFDATSVDAGSVRFGKKGWEATEKHVKKDGSLTRHLEDVNGDGLLDLLFHFPAKDTGFSCEDISLGEQSESLIGTLTGLTYEGESLFGTAALKLLRTSR